MTNALKIAVVGAGPAGIYAADILTKSETPVSVDLIERLPAPYGLVRYGVAPDHPRIKEIIKALRRVLQHPDIRFLGNVHYGTDFKLDDLRHFYDAVIFATGATEDRDLDIEGIDLPGSFGAADFVSWYDGHPDVPRTWPLTARSVAVLGAGNVAHEPTGKPHRLHLHFLENPVSVLGSGAVSGLRTERMELDGTGNVRGTGEFTDWDVQAVYRAVGYRSSQLADLPFDTARHVVPHAAGRVLDLDGDHLPGVYVTGCGSSDRARGHGPDQHFIQHGWSSVRIASSRA